MRSGIFWEAIVEYLRIEILKILKLYDWYEEKDINPKWLYLMKICKGAPVILEGKFSYKQLGDHGKYCFTTIRPFILGKNHRKEFGVLTDQLIVNVAEDTMDLLRKSNEQQVSGPKGRVYLIGYPKVYKKDEGRYCGLYLAYDLTHYPVRIKNGTWKIEPELYYQCCQLNPQKFLEYGEVEENRDIRTLCDITESCNGKPVIFLTKFAFNSSEDRRFIFKNARIFNPNDDPQNYNACIKELKVDIPYRKISKLCTKRHELLNGKRWHYIIGYPEIYMYKNKPRCGFRLAFDVTSEPAGAYTGPESISLDILQSCYIADSSKYRKEE